MELAFRESLKKMRGTKSKEKFSQELEMSRSNYSRIESGKSDPTIKTLEQIAKLTNSNASSGFNPKWANRTRTRNRTSNIGVRNGRRKKQWFRVNNARNHCLFF